MYERFQKITPKKGANRQTGKWMGGDILFDFTSWVQKMFMVLNYIITAQKMKFSIKDFLSK